MAIVDEARDNRQLVYAFDQSKSVICTQPGPWGSSFDGFCAGMAMKWLSLRADGQDFEFDPKTLVIGTMPHWHVTKIQTIYDDAPAATDYDVALATVGLKRTKNYTKAGAFGEAAFYHLRMAGLYVVRLRRPGGGHAVAVHADDAKGVYRYFDANYGHFVFDGFPAFKTWLTKFLTDSGYAARYTRDWFIHQVDKIA